MSEEIIEDVIAQEGPSPKNAKVEDAKLIPKQKNETWNRSIGVLSKKPTLVNLVKSKKIESTEKDKPSENISEKPVENQVVASGLSMLANYSGSDSDST